MSNFPFIDLKSQLASLRPDMERAILKVLDHGQFILGPEVNQLEKELSDWAAGAKVISCSNGTDALTLCLRALEVQPGDGVFVPSWTFCATAEVVAAVGAIPIFVDCDAQTQNIDVKSLDEGWHHAKTLRIKPVGIIAVDLFGQPADYCALEERKKAYGLWLIADAAQSFGASLKGRPVGSLADFTTTSFFPSKPLGCYGDGGAVFTDCPKTEEVLRSLRVHGQGSSKYDNVRVGLNARLDTLQAAILLEKIKIFRAELSLRQEKADFYTERLKDRVQVPKILPDGTSTWAQYTLILPSSDMRKKVIKTFDEKGIPWAIYYPIPLHQQKAYCSYPLASTKGLHVCENLSDCVLSLPMSAYITQDQQESVIEALLSVL